MFALAELSFWVIAIVCLALAYIATKLVIALLGPVASAINSISLGSVGTGWVSTVEQGVLNALGVAFGWVNNVLGASIHAMARLTEWLWHEIEGNPVTSYIAATLLGNVVTVVQALKALFHHTAATTTTNTARVKTLEREYEGIDRQLRTLEREYHGIDEVAIRHRLRTIENEVGAIETQTIPAIRQAESDASSAISNLYDWIKGKASILGVGTFAGAIAAALGLSSLSGFLCNEFRSILGRGCSGVWGGLENLLGLFVDLFIVTDLCDVIPLLEDAYSTVAAPAVALLTEAIDSTPCVSGNEPPALPVPKIIYPAPTSFTLSLP